MRLWLVLTGVLAFLSALLVGIIIVGSGATAESDIAGGPDVGDVVERDADVPPLPFDDNPDPAQCGIPVEWGNVDNIAWLSGTWDGELVQPQVLVYDSHLRLSVTGSAPHGTQVEIVLFQENPVLDYYLVRIPGETPQEGWVPEPFLSFQPVG